MLAAVSGTSPQRHGSASLSHEQPGEALRAAPRRGAWRASHSSLLTILPDLTWFSDLTSEQQRPAVEARGPWLAGGLSPSQPRGGSSQPVSRPYRSQDFISNSPASLTLSEEAI